MHILACQTQCSNALCSIQLFVKRKGPTGKKKMSIVFAHFQNQTFSKFGSIQLIQSLPVSHLSAFQGSRQERSSKCQIYSSSKVFVHVIPYLTLCRKFSQRKLDSYRSQKWKGLNCHAVHFLPKQDCSLPSYFQCFVQSDLKVPSNGASITCDEKRSFTVRNYFMVDPKYIFSIHYTTPNYTVTY